METQVLSDRLEIADLVALYCRGIDRVDGGALRSIFHADAVVDCGDGLFVGPALEWVDWALSVQGAFAMTQHSVSQTIVDLDGDVAEGETYFVAYHRFAAVDAAAAVEAASVSPTVEDELVWPDAETELILAGRYLDRFDRRDDGWRIAHRRMVCDWCRTQPAADDWFAENPTAHRGTKTVSDSRLSTSPRRS